MKNYGMKVSKVGESALKSTDLSNLIMTTRYPFAKIDPTNQKTFQTINFTFTRTPALDTATLLYSFDHDYTYVPQIWGLWNITDSSTGLSSIQYLQAYGKYTANSGVGIGFYLYYDVTATSVTAYIYPYDFTATLSLVGVVAKLTLYIFADDLTAQDYTIDT